MAKKGKSKTAHSNECPGNTFHGTMKKCLQLTEKTGRLLQKASQDMEKLKGKMNKLEDLVVVGIKKGTAEALKEMKKETKTTDRILEDLKKMTLKYKGSQPGQLTTAKPIKEGMVKKGGVNKGPITPRPASPKGHAPEEKPTPPPPEPSITHTLPPPEQTLPGSKKEPENNIVWCELKECQLHKEVAQEKYYKPRNKKCKACMECQEMSG